MLYTKTTPKGLDYHIQRLQTDMYAYLKTLWSVTDSASPSIYDSYGRIYRVTDRDGGIIPEAYTSGNEYRQVLFDDTRAVVSFYDTGDDIQAAEGYKTAKVGLYVLARLDMIPLYAASIQRMDEEVRNDVVNYIDQTGFGFLVTGIYLGAQQAMKTYSGKKIKEGMRFRDMHPYLCFRIDMKLHNYQAQLF